MLQPYLRADLCPSPSPSPSQGSQPRWEPAGISAVSPRHTDLLPRLAQGFRRARKFGGKLYPVSIYEPSSTLADPRDVWENHAKMWEMGGKLEGRDAATICNV